jgi:hypothetical protein
MPIKRKLRSRKYRRHTLKYNLRRNKKTKRQTKKKGGGFINNKTYEKSNGSGKCVCKNTTTPTNGKKTAECTCDEQKKQYTNMQQVYKERERERERNERNETQRKKSKQIIVKQKDRNNAKEQREERQNHFDERKNLNNKKKALETEIDKIIQDIVKKSKSKELNIYPNNLLVPKLKKKIKVLEETTLLLTNLKDEQTNTNNNSLIEALKNIKKHERTSLTDEQTNTNNNSLIEALTKLQTNLNTTSSNST